MFPQKGILAQGTWAQDGEEEYHGKEKKQIEMGECRCCEKNTHMEEEMALEMRDWLYTKDAWMNQITRKQKKN